MKETTNCICAYQNIIIVSEGFGEGKIDKRHTKLKQVNPLLYQQKKHTYCAGKTIYGQSIESISKTLYRANLYPLLIRRMGGQEIPRLLEQVTGVHL